MPGGGRGRLRGAGCPGGRRGWLSCRVWTFFRFRGPGEESSCGGCCGLLCAASSHGGRRGWFSCGVWTFGRWRRWMGFSPCCVRGRQRAWRARTSFSHFGLSPLGRLDRRWGPRDLRNILAAAASVPRGPARAVCGRTSSSGARAIRWSWRRGAVAMSCASLCTSCWGVSTRMSDSEFPRSSTRYSTPTDGRVVPDRPMLLEDARDVGSETSS